MKTICKLPDLANSFKLLKISVELEGIKDGGIIGIAIQCNLKNGNLGEVIKMIRESAADNRKMMEDIVGEKLLMDIETVKL